MGPLPYAFSVSHFINSVGADAGFASIIGLAVLVLLYFAQARETSALREQAYEAAQRVQQLEARLTALHRQTAPPPAAAAPAGAFPQPVARAAGNPVPSAAASPAPVGAIAAGAPAAPAGVGAPALNAATRLIPEPAPVAQPASPRVAALAAPDEASRPLAGPPAPATVAGAANGAAQGRPSPASGASGQPPPRIQIPVPGGPLAGRRPLAAPAAPARNTSSTGRRVLAAALVVLAVAAVVVALVVLTSSGGGSTPATSSTGPASNAPTTTRHGSTSAASPSAVTVAVLNGTATFGLAHRVAVKLGSSGYKQGTVATATDQTRTSTIVAYMPGHRRDAMAVATTLKLGAGSVQPVDQTTQAVACPPPGACTSAVVITVGSDLANIQ